MLHNKELRLSDSSAEWHQQTPKEGGETSEVSKNVDFMKRETCLSGYCPSQVSLWPSRPRGFESYSRRQTPIQSCARIIRFDCWLMSIASVPLLARDCYLNVTSSSISFASSASSFFWCRVSFVGVRTTTLTSWSPLPHP